MKQSQLHLGRAGAAGALAFLLALLRPAAAPAEAPLMRDFMGINGHFTFKPALYRPTCALVRNYHPTSWDLGGDTSRTVAFPLAQNKVDWSEVYGSWKKEGYTIDACLQFESIPAASWRDVKKDAFAYGEAFARYFGPSSHNLVTSVEIGNEPAKWNDAAYRDVFENMARGARAGDPGMKVVTAAAAAGTPDAYSKGVAVFKGLADLYDVLNIHTYSMIEGWPTWRRVNPEHPGIPYLKAIADMAAWRDAEAPGKEIWITEFGYDAGTKTGTGDFARWVSASETEQAQWIVRSFLVFSSLGVDRAYLYYYDDKDEPSFHASSGITRNFVPKPAYYAMAHLSRALGDYRFSRVVVQRPDDLYVFEYLAPGKPDEPVWVAWSPTGTQRETVQSLAVPGAVVKAERMPLRDGPPETVAVTAGAGGVELPVGESPTYLWLRKPGGAAPSPLTSPPGAGG